MTPKNKAANLAIIKTVAEGLGELNEKVAFVGGATVSIYADDPAAGDVRPTKDVDIVLEIASLSALEDLREELEHKGFHQSYEDTVVCRFRYNDILVDVMATQNIGWAPSDIWFAKGFGHLQPYLIGENTIIRILPVAYFLATKFSAHKDRGTDPRTSKDFEDIVYILDNHQNIVTAIKDAPEDVNSFLKKELKKILKEGMEEAVLCHLNPFGQMERFDLIMNKIKEIVK